MYSTHEAKLDLPQLPPAARHVHIVPSLSTHSLLSMGQLCDSGCEVTFTARNVHVRLDSTILFTETRSPDTALWHLSLLDPPADNDRIDPDPPLLHHSYAAVASATPPADLVAFAHASLFSPALSTLKTALDRGYLPDFPGLTSATLTKYPPQSITMIKGHMDQSRKNQCSTKPKLRTAMEPATTISDPDSPYDSADAFPHSEPKNTRTHHCYAAVVEPNPVTGQIHSDQTGRFVVASSTGNNYLLVVYDYDSNGILVEPMKNRTANSILQAFTTIHARLVAAAGLRPQLQRLDNECSEALKAFLSKESIDFQLIPPNVHRRNAAERAIRTLKNHFVDGLCSVDKHFPLHLWDKLLPQAKATLNMMRGSRINPKLSAHSQLHSHFDVNRTPLAPPGIRVLVHVEPKNRITWSPHGKDGWYTGPALQSFRCYTVWMWASRATPLHGCPPNFPCQQRPDPPRHP